MKTPDKKTTRTRTKTETLDTKKNTAGAKTTKPLLATKKKTSSRARTNTRSKRTKKTITRQAEIKRSLFVGFALFFTCCVLLILSFIIIPSLTKKQSFDTQGIQEKIQTLNTPAASEPTSQAKTATATSEPANQAKAETAASEPANQTKAATATSEPSNQTKATTAASEPTNQTKAATAASEPTNQTKAATATSEPTNQAKAATATSEPTNQAKAATATSEPTSQAKAATATSEPTSQAKAATPVANAGTLVFVFDDAGHNLSQLEAFLTLPFPSTIAVLPGLTHSKEAAHNIRQSKHELILHQPMQALNKNLNPGPGAITSEMTVEQAKAIFSKNLDEIAPLAGANNHEGSLITADYRLMKAVLEVIKEKNLIFLDSRTNAETQAPTVAQELNMNILERNIFLDNSKNREDMLAQIELGLTHARKTGRCIMIGHVFTGELAALLKELYPKLIQQGFHFARLSEIMQ
ncbi:MAG: divergent polysaccharide deacetylase family protein [Spirochaetaceae bacterium]|nr:divergent polysaccharide deacetylase family protein [Spirochaetaceae bacterium]